MAEPWVDNQREIWRQNYGYWNKNNDYGACNTGSGKRITCLLGGINCDVDHQFVYLRNKLSELLDGQ